MPCDCSGSEMKEITEAGIQYGNVGYDVVEKGEARRIWSRE